MRGRIFLRVAAPAVLAACALIAAREPSALAQAAAGLWEIDGLPGGKPPIRQCIANVAVLAQFEHRGRHCMRTLVSDSPASSVIQYSCGNADFGRSQIDVITPRSLRISTQGISENLPFNYVLEARRVGDCPKSPSAARH
jgi:hypothetical protein